MLGYYAAVAVAAGALLVWASAQPHEALASEEETGTAAASATLTPGQASASFPSTDVATFRVITQDTLTKVQAGDHTGAVARIKDLETAWDDDETSLRPLDETVWGALDGRIDSVLKAVRASTPDPANETQTLTALLTELQ